MRLLMMIILSIGVACSVFAIGALLGATNHDKYERLLEIRRRNTGVAQRIETALIDLRGEWVRVPPGRRPANGGGLASFGGELFLLTHEGKIYAFVDDAPKELNILTPDNGYESYVKAVKSGRWPALIHEPAYVRYHDILMYSYNEAAYIVVSYMEWRGDCYGNTVARVKIQPGSVIGQNISAESWDIVFRSSPCLQIGGGTQIAFDGLVSGGRMAYVGGHRILITVGDYMWDGAHVPVALGREMNNDYGKVLELDLENKARRIVSIGVRNAQGIARRGDGEVFTVEHGPMGGDELNHIVEGGDFGFPKTTLGLLYGRDPWPYNTKVGRHEVGTPPLFAWVPSVAPSSLTIAEGFHPTWDGDLLVGSLKAQTLFRIRMEGERVQYVEPISIGERIRDVEVHEGRIALWTDKGVMLFLSPAPPSETRRAAYEAIGGIASAERQERVRVALDRCLGCHSLNTATSATGPSLWRVVGRNVASTGYQYSPALKRISGKWSEDRLREFLMDTEAYAPGSAMPATRLSRDDAEGVIKALQAAGEVDAW